MNKFAEWMDNNEKVQKYVATKLGISPSTLHEILRLDKMPSIKVAYEIEKYTMGAITIYDWLDHETKNNIEPKARKKRSKKTME